MHQECLETDRKSWKPVDRAGNVAIIASRDRTKS